MAYISERHAIRETMKALLTDKTIAGQRIFTNRAKRISEEEMPALLIFVDGEVSGRPDQDNDGNVLFQRITIVVEGVIANTRDLDLELSMDQMIKDIRTVIYENDTLNDFVTRCDWRSVESDIVAEGRSLFGAVRVEFDAEMYAFHDATGRWLDSPITATPTDVFIREPLAPGMPGSVYDRHTALTPEAFRNDIPTRPNAPSGHRAEDGTLTTEAGGFFHGTQEADQ